MIQEQTPQVHWFTQSTLSLIKSNFQKKSLEDCKIETILILQFQNAINLHLTGQYNPCFVKKLLGNGKSIQRRMIATPVDAYTEKTFEERP